MEKRREDEGNDLKMVLHFRDYPSFWLILGQGGAFALAASFISCSLGKGRRGDEREREREKEGKRRRKRKNLMSLNC